MTAPKRTEPSIPITDQAFVYVNAANTDIRVRFSALKAKKPVLVQLKRKSA